MHSERLLIWFFSNLLHSEIVCSNRRGPKQGRILEDGVVGDSSAKLCDSDDESEMTEDRSLLFSTEFEIRHLVEDDIAASPRQ